MEQIKQDMVMYAEMWSNTPAGKDGMCQSDLYKQIIPVDAVSFTDTFNVQGLSEIFTNPGLSTELQGPWNCNHLHRDVRVEACVLLYSDDNHTVLHPLGDPGRGLTKHRISHVMIVTHGDKGYPVFNEMLPSSHEEADDLKARIDTLHQFSKMMNENAQIGECGLKVAAKAERMGIPLTTGIQQFWVKQIEAMTTEFRGGRPGYKLFDENGDDFAGDAEKVSLALVEAFSGSLVPKMFIKGPSGNTQLLSHIHLFMMEDGPLPEEIDRDYINVEMIYENKGALLAEAASLVRTATPPISESHDMARDVSDTVDTSDTADTSDTGGGLCRALSMCQGGVDDELTEPLVADDVGAPLARCSTPPIRGVEDDEQLTRTQTSSN